MCGIVTVISKNKSYEKLLNNLKKINFHRGPDKINTLFMNNYKILFRRLSIIDLSNKANQPFVNDKKTIDLVFNGEIYNYIEIKELESKVINTSQSDTEIIMRSYQFGNKICKQTEKDVQYYYFDRANSKIFFKDPIGQKPLYYSFINKDLVVSSEIKDIVYLLKKEIKK